MLVIIIRVVHLSYQLKHQRHQVTPCDLILDWHLKTELDPLTEKHAARDSLFITFVFQKKGIKDLTVIFEGKRYLVHYLQVLIRSITLVHLGELICYAQEQNLLE